MVELGELLTALPGRMTCLVASATAKNGDLEDALAAYSMFDLKGLILTKLDETSTAGNVYNLAARSRLPLMYFSAGPGVLDGLQPANAGRLVSTLFRVTGTGFGEG
jgi:flagellar biosynthesis protein FlhF